MIIRSITAYLSAIKSDKGCETKDKLLIVKGKVGLRKSSFPTCID